MTRAVALALLATATLATAADPAPDPHSRARGAASELVSTLQRRLMEELRAGGPARGIEVCSKEAPAIASAISRDGLTIRRVTTRPRNQANAPDPYEANVLESMESSHREGGNALEHEEIVETAGGKELRYLKPIVLAGPCLSCHGPEESLAPEVRDSLAARYPEDRATGYASGDFRGAVSVRVRID